MAKVWDPHLLIAFGGSLGSPAQDVWTNTLKALVYEPDGVTRTVLDVDEQDEILPQLAALVTEFIHPTDGTPQMISSAVSLGWVKANMIASTGLYMYPTTSVYDVTGVAGGVTTGADWRVSLVPTLLTAKARGKAHSGRFYPPVVVPTMASGTSPYVTTAQAQAMANKAYELAVSGIGGITLTSGKTLVTHIFSPGETSVGLEPVANMVIAVEVDRVPDTQRRRTNRVPRNVVGNA